MTSHDDDDAFHNIFINSTKHLIELLDGGSSVFVLKLGADQQPVEFDLSKRADLIAITRFHLRHLLIAVKDAREARDGNAIIADDLIAIIVQDLLTEEFGPEPADIELPGMWDRSDLSGGESDMEDSLPDPPRGLFDNE